jgi:hypothetical protein
MRKKIVALLGVVLLIAGLALSLLNDQPGRPRPVGWRDEWAGLPLEHERDWSMDPLKRGVVQALFFGSTDQLTGCFQKFGGETESVVKLELLVETEQGHTHFEYVEPEPREDLPAGLVSCITRVLEHAQPLPTPRTPENTRWRLEVPFLLPPLADVPKPPWWRRFIPERRSEDHIG